MRARGLSLSFVAVAAYLVAMPARADDPASLDAFVAEVKGMVARQASDADIARFVTDVIDRRVTNGNGFEGQLAFARGYWAGDDTVFNRWTKYDDEREHLNETCGHEYEARARWVWDLQFGHCAETATLAYYVLKNAGIRARIYEANGHSFTVMGVAEYAKGEHINPEAYVVDGWLGKAVRWSDIPNGTLWHPFGMKSDPTRTDVTEGAYDDEKRFEKCKHSGLLAGKVTENGAGAVGAKVVVAGVVDGTATTDGAGRFEIRGIQDRTRPRPFPEGPYDVSATATDGQHGSAHAVVKGNMDVTYVTIPIGGAADGGNVPCAGPVLIGNGPPRQLPCPRLHVTTLEN